MQILAQIKRTLPGGEFCNTEQQSLKNIGTQVAATILADISINKNGQNVVLVYDKRDSDNRKA